MRRISATFALALMVLVGCEQIFETNVFASMEIPPTVNVAAKSANELRALTDDPVFLKQLQNNPTDLSNVQTTLTTVMNSSSATSAEKADAARTYIELSAFGTSAGNAVTNAVKQLLPLSSGGSNSSISNAASALFAGQTAAQITETLNTLNAISTVFASLKSTYSPTDIFGSANKGDLAQIGIVAAAAAALIADNSVGAVANAFAAGNLGSLTLTGGSGNMDNLVSNLSSASGTYSYVNSLVTVFKP